MSVTRRSFLKWSSVIAGAAGVAGLTACAPSALPSTSAADKATAADESAGQWLSSPCYNNCSCGSARCLNRVYAEDGVPLKTRTDEFSEDSYAMPQRRACLRGRAKMSEVLSPARIKYPMKRKSFSLDDPHGELRGKDEWEQISWDEALDLVAAGIQQTIDRYGVKGILCGASSNIGDGYYDQNVCVLNALGGAVHHLAGTVSFGSWSVVDTHMLGGFNMANVPHHIQALSSDLHVMFGCNWAANKAGNNAFYLKEAQDRGAKIIIIDPWYNQTAQVVADQWIPILPGTDVALMLAIAYEWVQAGSYDQQFLNTYCVGFDDEHLPEGAEPGTSFKAYITGEGYDMVPKTPEWAQAICGVPADTIRSLAAEIASVDKVNFFCGQSVTKIPAGEQTAQAFYTMALIMDPENNPLATASGKFEIYSGVLAYMINSVGYSQIAPIAMYQPNDEQGAAARTDEYPLLLFTPHSLRRAHSVNDNVVSLREAFPQECFISVVDAQQRGISNGDTVLMTSPYGKCLRPAKVMSGLVPGAVALQDGAWFQIDEETGIDLGGCPNVLQAPRSSGGGCQAWTGTLVQVEKYEGPLKLEADKNRPVVTPVGIA